MAAALVTFASWNFLITTAHAQGTAFTYQGRLNNGTNPATGLYDLRFAIYDATNAGTQQGLLITNNATGVTNGLFTVTLDFGNQFNGANRWLDIAVRTNGAASFTALSPRQALTPTPYSITAANAITVSSNQSFAGANSFNGNISILDPASSITFPPTSGTNSPMMYMFASGTANADRMVIAHSPSYPNWGLQYQDLPDKFNFLSSGTPVLTVDLGARKVGIGTNTPTTALQVLGTVTASSFSGDGSGLTGLNIGQSFWRTNGNLGADPANGAYLGTADNLPLEIKVNGSRAWRLEPNTNFAPNLVGGSPVNFVAPGVVGAVIAGCGAAIYLGITHTNGVSSDFGSVGGGLDNAIQTNSNYSTIGGGNGNTIQSYCGNSIIGGGYQNTIQYSAYFSTISGGDVNTIQTGAIESVIAGGYGNTILQDAYLSTISGGDYNTIQTNANNASIGGGHFNTIQTYAYYSTIGGGYSNTNLGRYGTISGGFKNSAPGDYGAVGGGSQNSVAGGGTVGGGSQNLVARIYGTVGGGFQNTNAGSFGTVGGGVQNAVTADYGAVGGGSQNILAAIYGAVGGGYQNQVTGIYGTVSGGSQNIVASDYGTVGGGRQNSANNFESTVAGGRANNASGGNSSILGGYANATSGNLASIAGGIFNIASGSAALVAGSNSLSSGYGSVALGVNTRATNFAATASGNFTLAGGNSSTAMGYITTATGDYSTAFGFNTKATGAYSTALGENTVAGGLASTALGYFAQATNSGSLVWGDASALPAPSSQVDNSLTFRAAGGYRLFSNPNMTAGISLAAGATAWATISDQNAKKNFARVNGQTVLEKLSSVPVEQWNYKWEQDNAVPNIGPMAQAFKAAFYPGRDDKTITTLEFDGVELAAIQGLNQKLEEQKAENAELRARLEKLERLLTQNK
jgi:hypothetical protein